jgi:ATP-dependent RNA helicase RhlE
LKSFDDIELIKPLRRALAEEQYETPTPIQAKTIPPALEGADILGSAQTGTGKTAAFSLPILNQLGSENRRAVPGRPFVLVLAPTRELAIQIGESLDTYGRHLKLRTTLVFGGVNQLRQVKSLRRGSHILVATPGRLLDLMQQGHIELDLLEMFVLDEADRMLDMGFLPDLKRIIRELPEERQSLFFSATLPPKIVQLSQQLLLDPVRVNIAPKSRSVDKIAQSILWLERAEKQSKLQEILEGEDVGRVIVFTRTKRGANTVERKLKQQGVKAAAIHGNKSQPARQRTLEGFRSNRVKVLVATDVAARGIDVDEVTHVINYDLPTDPESYVHRIGRTGRAGAEGIAITFCTDDQRRELRDIEKFVGKNLSGDQPSERSGGKRSGNKRAGNKRAGNKNAGARPPQAASKGKRRAGGQRPSNAGGTRGRNGTPRRQQRSHREHEWQFA